MSAWLRTRRRRRRSECNHLCVCLCHCLCVRWTLDYGGEEEEEAAEEQDHLQQQPTAGPGARLRAHTLPRRFCPGGPGTASQSHRSPSAGGPPASRPVLLNRCLFVFMWIQSSSCKIVCFCAVGFDVMLIDRHYWFTGSNKTRVTPLYAVKCWFIHSVWKNMEIEFFISLKITQF